MDNGTAALYVSRQGVERRVGALRRVGMPAPKRELIDVTPLDSAARRFAKGKADCGTVSAECYLDGTEFLSEIMSDLFSDEALTVRLALAEGCALSFTALVAAVSLSAESADAAAVIIVEFRVSGGIEILSTEE